MLDTPLRADDKTTCTACMQGKLTKLPFKDHFQPALKPLQVIHADLVGPILPPSNSGSRYFLTIVDQYSGYIHTEVLINKNDAADAITRYQAFIEKQSGFQIKKLFSSGGGEFVKKELSAVFTEAGVRHVVSPLYTPQHNGFAERAKRTIIDMTRTMMMQANMAPKW
jgi:transposase InsO family protein